MLDIKALALLGTLEVQGAKTVSCAQKAATVAGSFRVLTWVYNDVYTKDATFCMSLYLHIYISTYLHIYVYLCVYTYIYIYSYPHTYIYIFISIYLHICISIFRYLYIYISQYHLYISVYLHICPSTYLSIHIYIYATPSPIDLPFCVLNRPAMEAHVRSLMEVQGSSSLFLTRNKGASLFIIEKQESFAILQQGFKKISTSQTKNIFYFKK